jgi:hypothetical protein
MGRILGAGDPWPAAVLQVPTVAGLRQVVRTRGSAGERADEKEQMSAGSPVAHKPCGRRLISGDVDAVAIAGAVAGPCGPGRAGALRGTPGRL